MLPRAWVTRIFLRRARMSQAPAPGNLFIKSLEGQGAPTVEEVLKLLQRNANNKQYNMTLQFTVTEANGEKPFFDSGELKWSGVTYGVVVTTEFLLLKLLGDFNELGQAIAIGKPPAA